MKELPLWMDKQRRNKEREQKAPVASGGWVRGLTEEHQVGGQQPSPGGGGAALANVYLLVKGKW